MHGGSNLDLALVRDLLSHTLMPNLQRIDIEPICESDIWGTCRKHDAFYDRDRELVGSSHAAFRHGVYWVPDAESQNYSLLPEDFHRAQWNDY